MKKFRKGFTLVELLIVIAVIGILGAMGFMGGQEANNIATATKIAEDFNLISAAMNMYYADNKAACDAGKESLDDDAGELKASSIKAGITPYLKSAALIADETNTTDLEGKYQIQISTTDNTWWLMYTIPASSVIKVGGILKNKAAQQGLKKSASYSTTTTDSDAGTSTTTYNLYEGDAAQVYMQVR